MPEIYDYDDETDDIEILRDSPTDSTFTPDGVTTFEQLMMLVHN